MNKSMKKTLALTASLALLLSACGNDGESGDGGGSGAKLQVVTTFYPMYEFSRQVAGDLADVVALVPAGAEPHDWEPSAQDMAKVKDADLFVYNGIVEGWVDAALSSAPSDKRVVVRASEGLTTLEGTPEAEEGEGAHEHAEEEHADGEHAEEEHAEGEHAEDPHVWLDPGLAQREVAAIEAAFEKADPSNKETYKRNADAYIAELKALDEAYRTGLQDMKTKQFVTQHAAFGYLAHAYGLEQVPIAGLSPEQEPSPGKMAEIVEFAKAHNVKTIFFETLVDPQVARTVAEEIGAVTDVLNPLEGLTDEEKQAGLDYIGIMKNNLEALKKALNA
ncbi:metal ABC transporter substrate-binding protein [Cohnella rhizoplanae]|uniref:metal ABC transporter substrate-binding protein n=1 Tax=Cohnella rhizoplanae TaxID=2974897 RepID=UPI0022FF91C1|nr:metal ABC transporter substrate-binding protein [Cohnella sp. JJ-181]CAI6049345.1 High-affinity zinc uptake system binding-protein ZnuA [Cohnella sp. JJ-181]